MAKFRNIGALASMDMGVKGFNMADDYGNHLREANEKVDEIQEVEETLYCDENSKFSGKDKEIEENATEGRNEKRNINFDPEAGSHMK